MEILDVASVVKANRMAIKDGRLLAKDRTSHFVARFVTNVATPGDMRGCSIGVALSPQMRMRVVNRSENGWSIENLLNEHPEEIGVASQAGRAVLIVTQHIHDQWLGETPISPTSSVTVDLPEPLVKHIVSVCGEMASEQQFVRWLDEVEAYIQSRKKKD